MSKHSIMRGFGSKALTDSVISDLQNSEGVRISFGLSHDGTSICIMTNNPVSVLPVKDAEHILESFRDTLEKARKIRDGEIKITIPGEPNP